MQKFLIALTIVAGIATVMQTGIAVVELSQSNEQVTPEVICVNVTIN